MAPTSPSNGTHRIGFNVGTWLGLVGLLVTVSGVSIASVAAIVNSNENTGIEHASRIGANETAIAQVRDDQRDLSRAITELTAAVHELKGEIKGMNKEPS